MNLISLFALLSLCSAVQATQNAPAVPRAPQWEAVNLDPSVRATIMDEDGEIVVRLDLLEEGRCLAETEPSCSLPPGVRLRFSATVESETTWDEKHGDAPPSINTTGEGICIGIEQVSEEGVVISAAFSEPSPNTAGKRVSVVAAIQPGMARLRFGCRGVDVKGTAVFRNLALEVVAAPRKNTLPHVMVEENESGGLRWVVDGEPFPLLMYHGNNLGGAMPPVIKNEFRHAYRAGIRVFSLNVPMPNEIALDQVDRLLDNYFSLFPEARFMLRVFVHANVPEDERMTYANGDVAHIASPTSQVWLDRARFNCELLVELVRESKYAHRFLGVIPMYHQTGEWIMWEPDRAAGFSAATQQAYRAYLRAQYGVIEHLNAAWGSGYVGFEDISVPGKDARHAGDIGLFRDPARRQHEISFTRFYNRLNPTSIIALGSTLRKAYSDRLLNGVFYGYTFEMAASQTWPQQGGHLGLELLLNAPDVQIIGSPYSYSFLGRATGYPVDLHMPTDSVGLHGKLSFLEEDTYTHLAKPPGSGFIAPGYQNRTHTMNETLAVLRRNLGVALARGYTLYWQSLLSDGRFDDPQLWDMYQDYMPLIPQIEDIRGPYRPQVAVVVDEASYLYQQAPAREIYGRWVYETRSLIARVDTTAGYYLQSDLDRIPDSVRCVVLLTPYALSADQQQALRARWMKDGRTVVFCYLPNVFSQTGFHPEGSAITGISLELRRELIDPESEVVACDTWASHEAYRFGDKRDWNNLHWNPEATFDRVSPHMVVTDPNAEVLARYVDGNAASCARKELDDWSSVYLGSHFLSPRMWRSLFEKAGCHLYLDNVSDDVEQPDMVEANDVFVMVQSAKTGLRTIQLPRPWEKVVCLDAGEILGRNTSEVQVQLEKGVPVYLGDGACLTGLSEKYHKEDQT